MALLTLLLGVVACSGDDADSAPASAPPASNPSTTAPGAATPPPTHAHWTFPGTDGARLATGAGSLHTATPIDIDLPGEPAWVVGVPIEGGIAWWVGIDDGSLVEVRFSDGVASPPVGVGGLPTGAPLAVAVVGGDQPSLVHPPQTWGSPLSHPVGVAGRGVVIEEDGRLRIEGPQGASHLDLAIPPDARLLHDGTSVLVVTGATDRYPHAALGDEIEGSSITLVDVTAEEARVIVEIEAPAVIEGTTPMWLDLDGDGAREVLVTVSDRFDGARLVLFDMSGEQLASGPAIGQGNRWRHQVAAAPFGPNGEIEVAAVLTPHIGGEVQFFRWVGSELVNMGRVRGFSSHRFLSRNLDMALAADADGDGRMELVVPTDDYRALGGIRRTQDGAEVAWTVPVGGRMSTNLAAAASGGSLSFAAGTEDAKLRIWP